LNNDLDVNGWDLGKALKLMLKGNAVIIEWLTSPIIYGADPEFRDEFLGLAQRVANRDLVGRHYLHLGERQRRTYFGDGKDVPQKKIFYALRPAAALRWLRLHPEAAVAPMHFPTLLEECEPPQDVAEIVQELIAQKMVTRELGSAPLPSVIGAFIDSEFERARALFERPAVTPSTSAREQADAFFRSSVRRLAPGT
jgi:predicted nucleotidyltransferase